MTTHNIIDTAEWIGLNIASTIILVVPNWYHFLPHIEHAAEFSMKVIIFFTVATLNCVKIYEWWRKNKRDERGLDKEP